MDIAPLIAGFVGGSAAVAVAGTFLLRRHLRAVRAAERRARSAERLAEIGAMTGGLAHEIKNPLSTIGLNAQLLAESIAELPAPDDERGRLLRRIDALKREVERLRGILQDFLDFAGELRLDRRGHDVNTIVGELADFFAPQCAQHQVRLRSTLAPGPLIARVDPSSLKQAVLNLLLNALQAIEQGRSATRDLILRTDRATEAGRPCARVHVTDTGPGIPANVLEQIFRPYFTTKSGGTGLGLPTARRIIEAHDGRLDVHSEPGRGTDFVITLPLEPTPTPAR